MTDARVVNKADQDSGRSTFERLSTVDRNEFGIDFGLILTAPSLMSNNGLFWEVALLSPTLFLLSE